MSMLRIRFTIRTMLIVSAVLGVVTWVSIAVMKDVEKFSTRESLFKAASKGTTARTRALLSDEGIWILKGASRVELFKVSHGNAGMGDDAEFEDGTLTTWGK